MCQYCGIPSHNIHSATAVRNAVDETEALVRRIALLMHQGKLPAGDLPPELVQAIATALWKGVEEGWDLSVPQNQPQFEWLQKAADNIFIFSGAKTATMLGEMRAVLLDENGTLRSFNAFRQSVLQINRTYNEHYLQAEYEHVVASAQMGYNWQQYIADRDITPYLQYHTAEDDRVRPAHAALNRVVRHVDDPFWDIYYPPNGWRCRCDVTATAQPDPDAPVYDPGIAPDVPPIFRTNVGKTGTPFPQDHPYFNKLSPKELLNAIRVAKSLESVSSVYIKVPADKNYYYQHIRADVVDLEQNKIVANKLASEGENVYILSHVKGRKNPEFQVNGKIADFKQPLEMSGYQKRIKSAAYQKCELVIFSLENTPAGWNKRTMLGKFRGALSQGGNPTVKQIWLLNSGKTIKLKRQEILDYTAYKKLNRLKTDQTP